MSPRPSVASLSTDARHSSAPGAAVLLARSLLGAALLGLVLMGSAACTTPPDRSGAGDGEGLDTEEVQDLLQAELAKFREEMGERYTSFAMGRQLSNKQASLESDLHLLEGRVSRGDISRFDTLGAEIDELGTEFIALVAGIEADTEPIRARLGEVVKGLAAERNRREVLDEELNAAYAEIHALREEMLGILGELEGYREAYRRILELRAQSLHEEQRLLDAAESKVEGGEGA